MTLAESIARLDVPAEERAALAADYADAIRRAPEVAARLPIADHPLLERGGDHQFREWLDHPDYDDYWRAVDALAEPARLRAPMLSIVGWWDNFLKSHFDLYRGLAGHAPHRLVCGPWEHTNYVSPFSTSRTGAVELGPDAACGVGLSTPLVLDWMDRWLLGRDAGAAGGVRYWQHGAERVAGDGGVAAAARRAALAPAGRGALTTDAPGDEQPDGYRYDPLDPVPTVGGKTLMPTIATAGIEDQSAVAARDDVLVYETPPLAEPVELHGPVRVELWASSSAVDTDFTAKLVDVAPDGFAANLADGIVRARHRDSPRTRSAPLEPGRADAVRASTCGTSPTRSSRGTGCGSRSARATSPASTGTRTRATSPASTGRTTSSSRSSASTTTPSARARSCCRSRARRGRRRRRCPRRCACRRRGRATPRTSRGARPRGRRRTGRRRPR